MTWFLRPCAAAVAAIPLLASAVSAAGTSADAVVEYNPGTISNSTYQQSGNAAIGLPASVDDGQTSPFTPPFHATSITIVGAGGDIVLHLASPAVARGRDIGVFTNTGLAVTLSSGVATATGSALGQPDNAIVSVSDTGLPGTFVPLNGGVALNLTMPSNAFDDAVISSSGGISVSGGTILADPYQPFLGTLSDFSGLTYPQMLTLLDGSFGGAWIDVSSANLGQINYVRFDVPAGDRLVLDAVTAADAIPEPASMVLLAAGALSLLLRRSRRSA